MSVLFQPGQPVRRKQDQRDSFWARWTRDRHLKPDAVLVIEAVKDNNLSFFGYSGSCRAEAFTLVVRPVCPLDLPQIEDRVIVYGSGGGGAIYSPTTGRMSSSQPAPHQLPKAPTMTIKTPEELRAEADAAQAAIEEAVAKKVKLDAISADIVLADATGTLLRDLHRAVIHNDFIEPSKIYATFRKQLSPVAETYGYKIVLVGDKTRATLVQA